LSIVRLPSAYIHHVMMLCL